MVNQEDVDRLTQQLQGLRGAIVRNDAKMADRVDNVIREAHRLHEDSIGTDFEDALGSVENLLRCMKRGLAARSDLNRSLRHAG